MSKAAGSAREQLEQLRTTLERNPHALRQPDLPDPAPVQAGSRYRLSRDATAMLEAIQGAAMAIAAVQDHGKHSEMQGLTIAEKAYEDIKAAEQRLALAEAAREAAEQRVEDAKARKDEAEQWVSRLQDAIHECIVAPQWVEARKVNVA